MEDDLNAVGEAYIAHGRDRRKALWQRFMKSGRIDDYLAYSRYKEEPVDKRGRE
ncbi:MAG: hypothetical protein IK064_00280 [Clostridia bacterium]|nr:hypothetical protein [Clostridia bacterium]